MGNLTQCESVGFREHPAYGFYRTDERNNSELVAIEKRLEKDKKVLQTSLLRLDGKKLLNHPNVGTQETYAARLVDYSLEQEPYCYRVLLGYQFVGCTFAERLNQLGQMPEDELMKMLVEVESALEYLREHSVLHSNVSPDTVLYDRHNNRYLLTDNRYLTSTVSVKEDSTAYQKALRGSTNQLLSERLMESLKHKSQTPQYTLSDDLFALGLMVLSAITQTPAEAFYDRLKFELRPKVFENKLRELGKQYSSRLIRHVKELLNEGMDTQPTTSHSLCQSLDTFNEQYSVICSKLRSYRVIDF